MNSIAFNAHQMQNYTREYVNARKDSDYRMECALVAIRDVKFAIKACV